jgi:predicted transglutaminase-like cysteine proteinase
MRQGIKFWAAVLAMTMGSSVALATDGAPSANFLEEKGKSLPPIGYVQFCAANPEECKTATVLPASRIKLSPEKWNELYRINRSVNARITPKTDLELYGKVEHWTLPTTAGDCEDYLLLKKKELQALGFPPGALLITVVLEENGEGHAVLTVASDSGDYILDNRRDDILLWADTNYKFIKRQTQRDPKQWVALDSAPATTVAKIDTSSQD